MTCGLCGHEMTFERCGSAGATLDGRPVDLCHADDHDCYRAWTVYGARRGRNDPSQAPVRPCCGQRHWTIACPDGRVMCDLCYDRFELAGLYVDAAGTRWNICITCAPQCFPDPIE